MVYNFKKIQVVPSAKDFIDIVLSRTQRKTPTEVHKGYSISRIRSFYMRKVKYTQQTYHDKLTQIVDDFPILDDIHPFYADLINVLYDKDHYKLALGQINTCRHLIDNIGKDYARLLKYGDSLYRCKQLKRAALGRMCTLMKKQAASLAYLEQVRQHMARLPSIDPNARTLIVCGFPNVGKSSFMNLVTRANVEVQPYAFTTKSLFVGHTDYRYLRWQVLDTPGILDRPLEDRNTIEMQSITALAHLHAAILFLIDISGQCDKSIKQQVELFNSIKPLFSNKPLIVVANKIDVVRLEELNPEDLALLQSLARVDNDNPSYQNVELVAMSSKSEEGVSKVKELACDKLLEQRIEKKLKGKQMDNILNRIHVAQPTPRDQKERLPFIPQLVLEARANKATSMIIDEQKLKKPKTKPEMTFTVTPKETPESQPDFDPTVFGPDWREKYLLASEEWKFDAIPEIIDGKNIADYIDPDILERLDELEREEEEREAALESEMQIEEKQLSTDELALLSAIRDDKQKSIQSSRMRKQLMKNRPVLPRTSETKSLSEFAQHLREMGIDETNAVERVRSRSRSKSRAGRKRKRDDENEDDLSLSRSRSRSKSSRPPVSGEGFRNVKQKLQAQTLEKKSQKKRNQKAKVGEADRSIPTKMPKHLFSGKRGAGKTQRR